MIKRNALALALGFFFLPSLVSADIMISEDWLSSGEDWYLIESKVKLVEPGIYMALHYLRLNTAKDYIEIFDGNFETVGYKKIGVFRSYQYLSFFDCRKNLVANFGTKYFSTPAPSEEHLVYKEVPDPSKLYYQPPNNPKLIERVCSIGRSR